MPVPESIQSLIEHLNQELDTIEQMARQGLKLLQPALSLFANNATIIGYFAYFSNSLLLIDISKRKIQVILDSFSSHEINHEKIQESGEELGEILGRIIERKIGLQRIINILETES